MMKEDSTQSVPMNLAGRRALVTGSSRGIGAAIAVRLAELGADVAINSLNDEANARSVVEAVKELGRTAIFLPGDISDPETVVEIFGDLAEQWGGLDILVNNAGWENTRHAIDLLPEEFFKAVHTNAGGVFLCSQQAARLMKKLGGGAIVNNLSIHAEVPRKGSAHYCTSKAAGQMLTKCLALEWAEYGIRVNAVCPGAIFTSKSKEPHNAEITEIMNRAIPAGRHGDVREIAEIVAFLASDAASYVTGSSLYADGGYRLATIPYDPRPLRNE